MSLRHKSGVVMMSVVAALGLVAGAGTASASSGSGFTACYAPKCDTEDYTTGDIVWYNRTATVTGKVYTSDAPDYTQAVFEAYAGSTKVGVPQTRTVSRYAVYKEFSFVAGDPDLVGGIDRIKVTLCVYVPAGKRCGTPYQAWRP